jgi:hypothetical protein
MATKQDLARKEAKRKAVVATLNEAHASLEILSGMWEEKTLDALILAFGIGRVELDG